MTTLLDRYEQWSDQRSAIWEAEESGFEDSEFKPDDMGYSDDEGIELLHQFQMAYEGAIRAASHLLSQWSQGDLAGAVNDLRQVLMLDTASSVSRQHFIDTGRYLQEGARPGLNENQIHGD